MAVVLASSVVASLLLVKKARPHIEVDLPPGFDHPAIDESIDSSFASENRAELEEADPAERVR